jgi:hypothetical protein
VTREQPSHFLNLNAYPISNSDNETCGKFKVCQGLHERVFDLAAMHLNGIRRGVHELNTKRRKTQTLIGPTL